MCFVLGLKELPKIFYGIDIEARLLLKPLVKDTRELHKQS